MAKITPIRIRKKDREEYKRLVRNSRAKINRIKKNYGIDVSSDVKIPSLDDFTTRQEYNAWKEQQQKFTSRTNLDYQFIKNKYDVVISKREKQEIERDTKKAQRLAKEMLKDVDKRAFVSGGKKQGTVGQRMLQVDKPNLTGIYVPADFNFDAIPTRSAFDSRKANIRSRTDRKTFDERKERMKDNFIRAVEGSFNSEANKLIKELGKLSGSEFYDMWLSFNEFDFQDFDSDGQNVDADEGQINQMLSYLEQYEKGQIDLPLINF